MHVINSLLGKNDLLGGVASHRHIDGHSSTFAVIFHVSCSVCRVFCLSCLQDPDSKYPSRTALKSDRGDVASSSRPVTELNVSGISHTCTYLVCCSVAGLQNHTSLATSLPVWKLIPQLRIDSDLRDSAETNTIQH